MKTKYLDDDCGLGILGRYGVWEEDDVGIRFGRFF